MIKILIPLSILFPFAIYHQINESRHDIAGYLFGPTCPRWIKILLAIGAYGGFSTAACAFILNFLLSRPELSLIAIQISSGLYLGDGLITHLSKNAPAHEDFICLSTIGASFFAGLCVFLRHFPWWVLLGLSVFIILRIIAARYKADHGEEISIPHS